MTAIARLSSWKKPIRRSRSRLSQCRAGRLPVAFSLVAMLVFVLCAGRAHAQAKATPVVPTSGPLAGRIIYHASYALLIGINRYRNLPAEDTLNYAVKDATDLRDVLVEHYGFPADHVTLLTDDHATKSEIESALSDLADSNRIATDDRVLIFFSGHGQTVSTAGGGDQGFLVPSDAQVDLVHSENAGPYLRTCIQMDTLWTYLDSCPAKHVLVIADACYSGLLAQERSVGEISPRLLARMASLRARQVITAGTKGQTSLELSTLGHGLLTYSLLEQLKAALPGDAFTASDLFLKVRNGVRDYSQGRQIPQLARHDAEGDFLFIPFDLQTGLPVSAAPIPATPADPVPPVFSTPPALPAPPRPNLSSDSQARANAAFIGLWTGPDGKLNIEKARGVTVEQVLQAVAGGADLAATDNDGNTPLMLAAGAGRLDCVKYFLNRGLNLNAKNYNGATALSLAVGSNSMAGVRFLLDQGVDVNVRPSGGFTALMNAAMSGNADCVKALLAAGAQVNVRADNDYTPLMWVSVCGSLECARALVAGGANVNAQRPDGTTAPMLFAGNGCVDIVEYLTEHGANLEVRANDGRTLLLSTAGSGNVGPNNAESCAFLLAHGADPRVMTNDGRNALMFAAAAGNTECVRLFLSLGFPVNGRDHAGKTALKWAEDNRHDDAIAVLKAASATE